MSGICRCVICNAVNNQEIATNPGDFTSTRFYETDQGDMCFYCYKAVSETFSELENEDETGT